jgi:hypothetical protein
MATIADLLASSLAEIGVEWFWGVTGDSLNGLNDSLRRIGRIAWMHVRREEVAASPPAPKRRSPAGSRFAPAVADQAICT